MTTYMVVRESQHSPTGTSYTGPFRRQSAAEREANAWRDVGHTAEVREYNATLKAEVRAWERAKAKSVR